MMIPDDIKQTLIESLQFTRRAFAPHSIKSAPADSAVGQLDKALAWLDDPQSMAELYALWPTVPPELEGVDLFSDYPIVGDESNGDTKPRD